MLNSSNRCLLLHGHGINHKREEFMRKLGYFLIVGLAFTVLQVASVEADDSMLQGGQPPMCDSNPACDPSDPNGNCCAGMCDPNPACVMDDPNAIPCCGPMDGPPPGGHHDGPPPGEHHDGPDCADPTNASMPECSGGPDGHHPPGEHHDGPPPAP